jgi:hypothetical protein
MIYEPHIGRCRSKLVIPPSVLLPSKPQTASKELVTNSEQKVPACRIA